MDGMAYFAAVQSAWIGEEAAAIANEAHGVFSRSKTDPDTERHGPAQTSAAR